MIFLLLTFLAVLYSFAKTHGALNDSRSREDGLRMVPTGGKVDEKRGGRGVGVTPTVKPWGGAAIDCNLDQGLIIAHTSLAIVLSSFLSFWTRGKMALGEQRDSSK